MWPNKPCYEPSCELILPSGPSVNREQAAETKGPPAKHNEHRL